MKRFLVLLGFIACCMSQQVYADGPVTLVPADGNLNCNFPNTKGQTIPISIVSFRNVQICEQNWVNLIQSSYYGNNQYMGATCGGSTGVLRVYWGQAYPKYNLYIDGYGPQFVSIGNNQLVCKQNQPFTMILIGYTDNFDVPTCPPIPAWSMTSMNTQIQTDGSCACNSYLGFTQGWYLWGGFGPQCSIHFNMPHFVGTFPYVSAIPQPNYQPPQSH